MPYVIGFLLKRPWQLFKLLRVIPVSLLFFVRLADHGKVKAALIRATLGGASRAELAAWTAHYVPLLIQRGTFADAIERIAAHRKAGDHLVLMSASPDLYVPDIARELGFDEAVCTGVLWRGDRLDGALTTRNRRGTEKTRCFEELRQRYAGLESVAYANGPGDIDHMKLVDRPLLVNGPPWARKAAALAGIPCAIWR